MSARWPGRFERALAVALALALPAGVLAVALPSALEAHRDAAREIALLEERRAALLERRRDPKALAALKTRLEAADPEVFGVLVAETVELARVTIQRQVQEVAAANGATVSEARAVEASEPGIAKAAVTLSLPPAALTSLLVDLANATPLVFVDAISIRRAPWSGRGGSEPALTLDLALSAQTLIGPGGTSGQGVGQ